MKYAYENLSDKQFEILIVLLCQRLLGSSVQGFAAGKDGGRDAKFIGTAELHPSTAAPWVGTTIVQAKHTNGYNRHFSESDFFNPKTGTSIIDDELPRIKNLRQTKQLDHYMLFANRRLAGNAESDIRGYIATSCSLPEGSIYLCGVEQLELYFKRFPDIPELADLDPLDSPLLLSPDELAEVIQAFARQRDKIIAAIDEPPIARTSYEEKNELNQMSAAYAKEQRRRFLKDTAEIRRFLADPENAEILNLYESVTEEFQLKIVAKRKDYQTFDDVMEYLVDLLLGRDPILRQRAHKRLCRVMLFYMYWNCDIGEVPDVKAN